MYLVYLQAYMKSNLGVLETGISSRRCATAARAREGSLQNREALFSQEDVVLQFSEALSRRCLNIGEIFQGQDASQRGWRVEIVEVSREKRVNSWYTTKEM